MRVSVRRVLRIVGVGVGVVKGEDGAKQSSDTTKKYTGMRRRVCEGERWG